MARPATPRPSSKAQTATADCPEECSDQTQAAFVQAYTADNLRSSLAEAIQRARTAAASDAAIVSAARAKTEAARRQSHRLRVSNVRRWSTARAKLLSVVLAIDTALQPDGMALSMADFAAHPADVAAVQVLLTVLGRPCRAILEIVVLDDLTQRIRVVDTPRLVSLPALPAAPRTETRHYHQAVIAYVEAALPERADREDMICRKCGLFIPATGVSL